jgi:hypothetical protein
MPIEVLEFKFAAGGVHKVMKSVGALNMHMGSVVRNGKRYDFLPQPFVAFTGDELEQISNKIKEFNANAT